MFKLLFAFTAHIFFTVLILNSLNLILPHCLTNCYYRAANILLCILIAKWTFGYSKKLLSSGKVDPHKKAVLITGCARGLGKLMALHLDSKGFHVFAGCLNPNSPGAEDLRKSCSNRLHVFQMDVTKDESVEKAVHFVKANLGSSEFWAVINNAGIQKGFITELTRIQDFQETMEVNTWGQIRVTKAFLPLLRKSQGRVINIASLAGRILVPMITAYTMSKAASIAFSKSLRQELYMWGIPVISIEPEFFETEMTDEKSIMKRVDDTFASADEAIRKDYGKEYLRRFKRVIATAFPPSSNFHKLLGDIECAVTLKNPDAAYRIYRNEIAKLVYNLYGACPIECQDFLGNAYYRFMGLPKPETAYKIHENYHSD